MAETYSEARDAINALVTTAWSAVAPSSPLLYDNLDSERPATPTFFGRVTVRFFDGRQASLGSVAGGRVFRREGLVYVQVFTPHGKGLTQANVVSEALVRAIENPGATGNIWFRDAHASEIGSDGAYYQINVVARFQYDRIA